MKQLIYIVEDDSSIGFILELFLIEEGFEVTVLPTAASFHSAINTRLPDLFLLDVMLSDGNGINLCDEIKKNANSKHLPVLIMSAHEVENAVRKCEAEDFLSKPFNWDQLLFKIKQYLPAA